MVLFWWSMKPIIVTVPSNCHSWIQSTSPAGEYSWTQSYASVCGCLFEYQGGQLKLGGLVHQTTFSSTFYSLNSNCNTCEAIIFVGTDVIYLTFSTENYQEQLWSSIIHCFQLLITWYNRWRNMCVTAGGTPPPNTNASIGRRLPRWASKLSKT